MAGLRNVTLCSTKGPSRNQRVLTSTLPPFAVESLQNWASGCFVLQTGAAGAEAEAEDKSEALPLVARHFKLALCMPCPWPFTFPSSSLLSTLLGLAPGNLKKKLRKDMQGLL